MPDYSDIVIENVKDITVKDRYREDFGDIDGLAVSIQHKGLMFPIIIDDEKVLIDGERRLRAHKLLGKEEIETRHISNVTEDVKKEIELEANARRKDFSWTEEIIAYKELFDMKREIYGKGTPKSGEGYSLDDLAQCLGRSTGSLSMDISLARALETDETLRDCRNKGVAYKMMKKRREKKVITILAEKVREKVEKSGESQITLLHGDSTVEMKKLPAESVDFILFDPPYGKNIEHKDGMFGKESKFEDGKYSTFDLLDVLFRESYRVLKEDRVLLCFCDFSWSHALMDMLEKFGFNLCPTPLIWCKGTPGVAPMPYYYSQSYEMIIHAMKGERSLNKHGEKNYIECDRVPQSHKIHATQKPIRLLRFLIEQHSLPGELVVDPCAGSGATLLAADSCNRISWGCELGEDAYNKALIEVTAEREEEEEEEEETTNEVRM